MTIRQTAIPLVICVLPLAACASAGHHERAAAPGVPTGSSPFIGTRPLTCFPSTLTASVAGVPADQALKTTPLVATVADPVAATMTLPAPSAGSVHTMEIDGTGDDPGVRPAPGLYGVVVVQDITVNWSCVIDSTAGPGMGFDVQTTIGRVRFP
jgi:hypothetical protein